MSGAHAGSGGPGGDRAPGHSLRPRGGQLNKGTWEVEVGKAKLQVEGLAPIVANDFSEAAVGLMKENIERNGVRDKVKPSYADAMFPYPFPSPSQ